MARNDPPTLFPAVAFALSTLFCATAASAQSAPRAPARGSYGVMAGVNFATLGGSNVEGAKTRTGLVAGVYAAWPISSGLSFQPELVYDMEGAKASDPQTEATIKLDYVRLPLMLRYTSSGERNARPFLALGPSLGYQVGCNVSGSASGVSVRSSCDALMQEVDLGRKKFDASGRLEAGIDFAAAGRTVTIGGAYSYGFTDLFKNANTRNRAFSVFAAFGL